MPDAAVPRVLAALDDETVRAAVESHLEGVELPAAAEVLLQAGAAGRAVVDHAAATEAEAVAATTALEEATRRASEAEESLAAERRTVARDAAACQALEAELAGARKEVRDLTASLGRLRKERDDALEVAQAASEEAARHRTELDELSDETDRLRSELEAARTELGELRALTPAGVADADLRRVHEAGARASRLADDLHDLARELGGGEDDPRPARSALDGRVGRRTPPPLPGGIDDGSVEAAAHWLGLPGVAVIVDGYNVAFLDGAGDPAEARQVLLQRLRELVDRCRLAVQVVFDGAGAPSTRHPLEGDGLTVTFSPEGVEADDVVLDLLDGPLADRSAVVVSSDGRVRAGSRARGAAVVTSQVFRQVLGDPDRVRRGGSAM